jgi:NAD(P)H-dependent flavin oxidoreductase YrpB (nitropropane dioxygenase family)
MRSSALVTPFTQLVGCRLPIQLAGMPGIATPSLAAAVANAGGLGMIGGAALPADALEAMLSALRSAARGVVGVNFLVPFLDRASVAVAAPLVRVVEFFYGAPDATLVDLVHGAGALASWQVGSPQEGRAAVEIGCDFIVAQGTEAGGHVRGCIGLLPLLTQLLDAVPVPVVAAGGIATGRDVAAVLAAGAAGVRIGTRFVAAAESGAHPAYVDALLRAGSEDTVLTQAFSVMWPDAPHRVLRSCIEAADHLTQDPVGEVNWGGQTMPIPRFAVIAPTTETRGRIEAMALYAGQSVGAVTRVQPAAEIIDELVDGAARLLSAACA